MKTKKFIYLSERVANYAELLAVTIVLCVAFLIQFAFEELPCPLCLLQRFGFVCIAYGLLLNLRFGFRPSHYAIVILSAVFTAFVALRQIALHVLPGTGAYGSAIFGLHLYTWSFIAATLVIISTTVLLGADRQYSKSVIKSKRGRHAVNALFLVVVFLIVANVLSVFLECGWQACPDNPITYELTLR